MSKKIVTCGTERRKYNEQYCGNVCEEQENVTSRKYFLSYFSDCARL